MKDILFWAVPPVVGAFIGYATNVVAIKMLFRPLKEVRIFGVRLPFTPGILPRERKKLAESIGAMVERELFTPGVLRERLVKTEVREKMGNALGAYTEEMLERPVSDLTEDSPGGFPLAEMVRDFINSEVFNSYLEEIVRIWVLGRFSSQDKEENGIGSWFKSRVKDVGAMFVPAARDLIKSGLTREIKNQNRGEIPLPRQALENILSKYPDITLREFLSLGSRKKQIIDAFLTEKAVTSLDDNIEGALNSVNVRVLVSDRINALDMIRVEKIILDVMAGQLQWINIFGGILGALIGFAQVILSLVMR